MKSSEPVSMHSALNLNVQEIIVILEFHLTHFIVFTKLWAFSVL